MHHPVMPKKSAEDLEVENRIRAHLRQQMAERGISPYELARRLGSDDGNIYRLLAGERGFGPGMILRICRALKITPTRLIEEDPPVRYWRTASES